MSDQEDDYLPDLDIGGEVGGEGSRSITKVNVDAEIAQGRERKERREKIQKEAKQYHQASTALPVIPTINEPTISGYPPNRAIFDAQRSLRSFNFSSLIIKEECPSHLRKCTSDTVEEFCLWLRSHFKDASDESKRYYNQYLWLLLSCHPDSYVVQSIFDFLIEFNACWRLKYDEVILVLFNWGVPISDFVTNVNLNDINAPLEANPIISAYNVEKVSSSGSAKQLVISPLPAVHNIERVLQYLSYQLNTSDLDGTHELKNSVLTILSLLTLDERYKVCECYVQTCFEQLVAYASAENSGWVADFCRGLFQVESHHARLAYLAECVLPESLRWCFCLAHCQKTFSLPQTFDVEPDPSLLRNIVLEHIDDLLNLEPWNVYSLITIVHIAISGVVSSESGTGLKRDFLLWLSEFEERKRERRPKDIDVDGTLISELISRLQTEWESTWHEDALDISEIEDKTSDE